MCISARVRKRSPGPGFLQAAGTVRWAFKEELGKVFRRNQVRKAAWREEAELIKDNRRDCQEERHWGRKKMSCWRGLWEASRLVHWIKSQVDPLQESPQQKVQRLDHAGPRSQGGHPALTRSSPRAHKEVTEGWIHALTLTRYGQRDTLLQERTPIILQVPSYETCPALGLITEQK